MLTPIPSCELQTFGRHPLISSIHATILKAGEGHGQSNVITLYEIGKHDWWLFAAAESIEGNILRQGVPPRKPGDRLHPPLREADR